MIGTGGIPADSILARPLIAGGLAFAHPSIGITARRASHVRRLLEPAKYYVPVNPRWATWATLPKHYILRYLRGKLGRHVGLDALVWAPSRSIMPGPSTLQLSPMWRLAVAAFLQVRDAYANRVWQAPRV